MHLGLDCRFNNASSDAILVHLTKCDEGFVPRLSGRVSLNEYSAKLALKASSFEMWSSDILVGLVAGYFDTSSSKQGYISNVSVLPEWHGRGVGRELLDIFLRHSRENEKVTCVTLNVSEGNSKAIAFYLKMGFAIKESLQSELIMEILLGEENEK